MLAVIEMGSKQYRVEKDQVVYVELTGEELGKEIEVPKVLLITDGEKTHIGQPYLDSAKVTAKVLEEVKAPKIHGFTYKKRKNQHKKWGHRQKYHKLQITSISA